MEITSIILLVLLTVLFVIGQIKLIYRRYLKSYDSEIQKYLESKGLTLFSINSPNNLDWKDSPFEKPSKFGIGLFVIQFSGIFITWNKQDYKVIETNEKKLVWLEIDTTYFKKTELNFKITNKRKPKKSKQKGTNKGIIKVFQSCPACNFSLSKDDKECPDCGLNFI